MQYQLFVHCEMWDVNLLLWLQVVQLQDAYYSPKLSCKYEMLAVLKFCYRNEVNICGYIKAWKNCQRAAIIDLLLIKRKKVSITNRD